MAGANVNIGGMGCVCAAGVDLPAAFTSMLAGVSLPRPPTRLKVSLEKTYPVFEVDGDPPGPDWLTRGSRLMLKAALEALADAGLAPRELAGKRLGVCVGTTVGATLNNESFHQAFMAGLSPAPEPVERYLDNNPAQTLTRLLGSVGPYLTVVNACASGADAIGVASAWIKSGRVDMALAGGVDELSRVPYLGFISLLVSSERPCRPFDRHRDGLNLGEGAAFMLLESDDAAAGRGNRPNCRVAAYANAADAYHPTKPHPEGRGLRRALLSAAGQTGTTTLDLGFVNAHGTATPDNDKVEGQALAALCREGVPVVSTKSYTGHTLGAAGALEAVFTAKSLLEGRIPATARFADPDPDCGVTPTTAVTATDARFAASTSLAFGGANSCLVIERI